MAALTHRISFIELFTLSPNQHSLLSTETTYGSEGDTFHSIHQETGKSLRELSKYMFDKNV